MPTRLTNAEMASSLYVSVNTLETHVRHIYVKLDADGRDEAVERATQLGIL
ncbi:MAG TPA: LuxR C-terminal-related transcriptional regulator [Ilumatobacteraceae bacterium]|nr:LuxR C-terminal-related transcriptional regulator [Ilumatobacteraceae bacterium]